MAAPDLDSYVHGYSRREDRRLRDQASTLTELLHGATSYPAGDRVLEAGCGVGAQTVTLARRSPAARFVSVQCLVDLQARAGGDSLIGRSLYPLLVRAGFADVQVSPRMVYVDASRPELVEGFTKNTFTAMVEGVRERALVSGAISESEWTRGVRDLYRTAESDGTFCYCFFKALAVRP